MPDKRWILVLPGGEKTLHPTIEAATAAGERFLLDHPSECRVALHESGEDGIEKTARLIFHWREKYFHYLDAEGKGEIIKKFGGKHGLRRLLHKDGQTGQ